MDKEKILFFLKIKRKKEKRHAPTGEEKQWRKHFSKAYTKVLEKQIQLLLAEKQMIAKLLVFLIRHLGEVWARSLFEFSAEQEG